jgi:hypothetical protein
MAHIDPEEGYGFKEKPKPAYTKGLSLLMDILSDPRNAWMGMGVGGFFAKPAAKTLKYLRSMPKEVLEEGAPLNIGPIEQHIDRTRAIAGRIDARGGVDPMASQLGQKVLKKGLESGDLESLRTALSDTSQSIGPKGDEWMADVLLKMPDKKVRDLFNYLQAQRQAKKPRQ